MKIEISIGECLDRLSILDIKKQEIMDPHKREHIINEISTLDSILSLKDKFEYYYDLLVKVNRIIWDLTNESKRLSKDDYQFSSIASQIFDMNQSRFRIKQIINKLYSSSIQEQKSYDTTRYCITMLDEEPIPYDTLTELSLQFDVVCVHCSLLKQEEFLQSVPSFNYIFSHK